MNLKSTTANGLNFRIINSLMDFWGVRLIWRDCKDVCDFHYGLRTNLCVLPLIDFVVAVIWNWSIFLFFSGHILLKGRTAIIANSPNIYWLIGKSPWQHPLGSVLWSSYSNSLNENLCDRRIIVCNNPIFHLLVPRDTWTLNFKRLFDWTCWADWKCLYQLKMYWKSYEQILTPFSPVAVEALLL